MKNIYLVLFCLNLIFTSLSAYAEGFGIVDNGQVFEQYTEVRKAENMVLEARENLNKMAKALDEDLSKSLESKDFSEVQKLQKRKESADKLEAEKKKLDSMIAQARQNIENKIEKAIQDEAKAQNLSMVFAKNTTFYGGKDITQAVLSRLK